jgi:hypothetical protein
MHQHCNNNRHKQCVKQCISVPTLFTTNRIAMAVSAKRRKDIAQALTLLAPRMPFYDAEQIREAACAPHMRTLTPQNAVRLAALAYIRHTYTDYDKLRDEGLDKDSALYWINDQVIEILNQWNAINLMSDSGHSIIP